MTIMAEKKIWEADNDKAHAAMESALTLMLAPQGSADAKLKAAKLILEYTQTKPVVKSETTVKTAEDFLAALVEDEENAAGP
jgi:hypothetical protein